MVVFYGCKSNVIDVASNHRLIDYLNDQLNEAVIQDGFSPPVASKIYAYCNLAAYEALQIDNNEKKDLTSILNDYNVKFETLNQQIDKNLVIASAFCNVALDQVYRDFIIDSLLQSTISMYKQTQSKKVANYSIEVGEMIAKEIISYSKGDRYDETRSYPLYKLLKTPGSWEPTPPYYGTPIEPHWGKIRPFIIKDVEDFSIKEHIPFDTIEGSLFYNLNYHIYEVSKTLSMEDKKLAMHWDGDPMPPKRLKHINLIKRQLNPVGHWLALGKKLNNSQNLSDEEAIETYLKVSLACADAMIVGWHFKYSENLIRPQTYINRYIDESWDPTLVTPLFPEYPSGHSLIAGSCSRVLIDIFTDTVSIVDDTQIKYGHEIRHYKSISAAAQECAESRVLGGIHYIPAVEVGVTLGGQVGDTIYNAFTN